MRFGAQVTVACAVMALAVAPTRAASNAEAEYSSRQHFQKAETHYSAGRFAEALTEYQAGYDAHPLPGFLVNIAQCHRRLGNLQRARATYERFVWVAPDSPLVPEVRSLIAEVDRLMSENEGAGPDGNDVAAEPSRDEAPPISLAPASVPSTVSPPGAKLSLPSSETPPGSTTTTPRRWWLWGAVGVAVLGGAVAAVALSTTTDPMTIHEGTLGTLRR